METNLKIEDNLEKIINRQLIDEDYDEDITNDENSYLINLELPYTNMDAFKQKALAILRSTIAMSTLCDHMCFESYGMCEYTQATHMKARITPVDRFTRGKIHCVIFRMYRTKYNPGIYDRCIIFSHTVNNTTFYNYVMLNTETGENHHMFCLDYADDAICRYLKRFVMMLPRKKIYNFYSKKYDALKRKDIANIPTVTDYADVIDEWNSFKSRKVFEVA